MAKYQHKKQLRGIGFVVQIASILFSNYLATGEKHLSQQEIIKTMDIPAPNFYRHMNWDKEAFNEQMAMLGVTRVVKKNRRVVYLLDIDTYKNFIFNS